jgi:hypothetical protein
MITNITRAKGCVVMKMGSSGDRMFYVKVRYQGETERYWIRKVKDAIAQFRLSPDNLPPVYGEIITYEKVQGIQHKKFHIKGIDNHNLNQQPTSHVKAKRQRIHATNGRHPIGNRYGR